MGRKTTEGIAEMILKNKMFGYLPESDR